MRMPGQTLRQVVTWMAGLAMVAPAPASSLPEAAVELALRDLEGAEKGLSDYRGRVVVLNFWATWCVPCREEMPLLAGIARRYSGRGVVVVGAAADDASTEAQIPEFLRRMRITFPVWKGATTEHLQRLGLGSGLPATAILDQEGRLAFRILGVLQRRDLEQRLEYLLGGRLGPSPAPLVGGTGEAAGQDHGHGEEGHQHGGVGMEGASTVPS